MTTHFYLKYAIALLMTNNQELREESQIEESQILEEIKRGFNHYAINPSKEIKKGIKYEFSNDKKEGGFLTPYFLDKKTKELLETILQSQKLPLFENSQKLNLTKSVIPTFGEYSSFSTKGMNERAKPKGCTLDIYLGCITSSTPYKPCFKGKDKNWFLIPDFEKLDDTKSFIKLFKRIEETKTKDLMIGLWRPEKKETSYPPKLLNGNFPNPPQKAVMGPVALLGAIGEMVKEKEVSDLAYQVVESLKDSYIYVISANDIQVFTFNHVIIELAAEKKLNSIINGVCHVKLFNENEDEKYDFFASRFLQLLNKTSFRDFLSIRAEYPLGVKELLTTYFYNMEKIEKDIIESAVKLGQWLNRTAFISALNDVGYLSWKELNEKKKSNEKIYKEDYDKVVKTKNKVLIGLESSIISAKSGPGLIGRIIPLAARLCGRDVCKEATPFMKEVATGELSIENAKNLLLAFSRLESREEE